MPVPTRSGVLYFDVIVPARFTSTIHWCIDIDHLRIKATATLGKYLPKITAINAVILHKNVRFTNCSTCLPAGRYVSFLARFEKIYPIVATI